jgi:hypothetical protein
MLRTNPIPQDLALYLRETAGILEKDIKICERAVGFDRFHLILTNGFEFYVTGPVLENYNQLRNRQPPSILSERPDTV